MKEEDGMAYRGGPWRADGPLAPVVREGRRSGTDPTEQVTLSDRMLRRVVYAYLATVVAAALVGLVGLHEGLW
jgi:hypothetical protein